MSKNKKSNYTGITELLNIDNYLKNYNLKIVEKFVNDFKSKGPKILDFGAGIGTLSELYFKMTSTKPICIETDIHNQNFLKKKRFEVYNSLENINILFDSIFSCNVLEHIKNDQEVITNLYDNLRKDGLLFLYVPAFQFLYSEMDKSVGHVRRYEKKELIRKVKKSGFKIVYCNYADAIGFFASIIIKFFGYDTNKEIGSKKSLIFYNKIVGLSFFLDNLGFKKFLGKNIVLLAKK